MASGKNPPVNQQTPPPHPTPRHSTVCRQQHPAVSPCPMVNLFAVHIASSPKIYVLTSDRISNATFHYCGTEQPEVARKMDLRGKGRFNAKVEAGTFGL